MPPRATMTASIVNAIRRGTSRYPQHHFATNRMTFLKTRAWVASEVGRTAARMPAGMPRDEAKAVHRGADHRDPEGGRGGGEEHRSLPASRHQRADLLPLESEVRWPRGQ